MPAPQAPSILQHTGGALGEQPEKDTMCQAFVGAVEEWCREAAKGVRHAGDFNDYFFAKLQSMPEGCTKAMRSLARSREIACFLPKGENEATVLRAAGGQIGEIFAAAAMTYCASSARCAAGFRWSILRLFREEKLFGYGRPFFPDGMLRNTPVEIKGPRDVLLPAQAEKYEKLNGKGRVIVISCQSCKAPCASTNACP